MQALESGPDATGVDIAAFNCLPMRVKTERYNVFVLEREVLDALARFERLEQTAPAEASAFVREWYAPRAAAELLSFGSLVDDCADGATSRSSMVTRVRSSLAVASTRS